MKRYKGSESRFRRINVGVAIVFALILLAMNGAYNSTSGARIALPSLVLIGVSFILIFRLTDTSVFDIEVDGLYCTGPKSLLYFRHQRAQIKLSEIIEVQKKSWWAWRWPARLTIKGKDGTAIHIRLDYYKKAEAEAIVESIRGKGT